MSAAAPISALDRSLAAFRALVLSVYPAAVYWITHEYEVVESDGATFSGTPTDAAFSPPLPTHVPYSPALAGASCVVPPGTLAYVAFANADPAKPFLVRFGQPSTATAIGLANAALVSDGGAGVARVGDLVVYLLVGDTLTTPALFYATTPPPAANWTPIATVGIAPSNITSGTAITITQGSGKVSCG